MASSSGARGVRHVRCPKCRCLLQEPSDVPVYQCGGCGATLRAKNRSNDVASSASPSRSGPPPPQTPSRQSGSGDVASTSRSSTPTSPHARISEQQPAATASRRYGSGDLLVSARRHHGSSDVARSSSTPDVRTSDLVSARRNYGSNDVAASSSSLPDVVTSTRRQETNRRETSDLVSVRKERAGEVATSSSSAPDATTSTCSRRQQGTEDTGIQRESCGDLVPASSKRVSAEHVPATEKKEHEQSSSGGAHGSSEFRRQRRDTDDLGRGGKDQACSEPQTDSEKRGKGQSEPESPDAVRRKHSAAVQPQVRGDREEPAPRPSVQDAESKPSRDVPAPAARGKVPTTTSPPRHHHRELLPQGEDLAPLRQKILKTVDALKGDLSELFSKSPDLNPTTTRARPPHPRRVPDKQQQGHHASRAAAASTLRDRATTRARHAAAVHGSSAVKKPAPPPQSWRGLPSRRYRRCRADHPCCCDNNVQQPRTTCHYHHHGCCGHQHHHDKPECSSCRGHHCCRPTTTTTTTREPSNNKEARKRRPPPPGHHCRPVLKGAPFIICSSCFALVQVPADFAVSTNRLRKLRCGACAAVLSYSYRDPARKQLSSPVADDHHQLISAAQQAPDPFAPFVDGFGLSSYSTTDAEDHESSQSQRQRLHVSRNTSFGAVVDDGAAERQGRLHRLMGYGSASELLRHSPDLYESFHEERTTPDYDRKGKGVCVVDDAEDDDDSDDDGNGVLRRGAVWPMMTPGVPGPAGAIRIKS
ncbi:hypothetical protein PR202_gb22031 [Eleusine coracana subsp. coracana]|uniref:Zinc-ribbon domain-containing protein n=1 Tax=Eleusine coracana subsp. coracana TaxID=191504 RepID=A0AAV5FEP8_ELECO|nr:hypothetical protein QOZ80_7BG0613030 [Eleusine coracana subsp. coracana]GJN33432.1 hypothetical protein PR202_gb22031 [Eleusine coracana subsp. coracana]